MGDEFPLLGYNFESGGLSNVVTSRVQKSTKVDRETSLEVPDREVECL